jgi:hypothetical protein
MPGMLNNYSRNAAAKQFRDSGSVAKESAPDKRGSATRNEADASRGEEKSPRADGITRSAS